MTAKVIWENKHKDKRVVLNDHVFYSEVMVKNSVGDETWYGGFGDFTSQALMSACRPTAEKWGTFYPDEG